MFLVFSLFFTKTDFLPISEVRLSYQRFLRTNSSILPIDYELFSHQSLKHITFTDNAIGRIMWGLHPNKIHDHGMKGICMIRIFGDSILAILRTYLQGLLRAWGIFFKIGKKPTLFLFIKGDQTSNKEQF